MVTMDFSKFEHNLSDGQIIDAFQNFCSARGLIFQGSNNYIIADGKVHYVKVDGRSSKNKNKKSGWYVLNLSGDIAKGKCGWYHGENPSYSWHLYYDYIKPNKSSGKARLTRLDEFGQILRDEKRNQYEIEKQMQEHLNAVCAKVYTAFEFYRSLETRYHSYIERKNIEPTFVRTLNPLPYSKEEFKVFLESYYPQHLKEDVIGMVMAFQENKDKKIFFSRDNILIIAGIDFDFNYKTFQYILPKKCDKQKLFLGIPLSKQGSFSLIYAYDLPPKSREVRIRFIICEGWATGVALYKLTKGTIPIIVAWDAGNLPSVARGLRNAYYSSEIYICGDNDHDSFNKSKGEVVNAGLNAAKRAAMQVKAVIALPPFDSNDLAHKGLSDWDDYLALYGFDKTQEELRRAMRSTAVNATYQTEYNLEHPPVKWSDRMAGCTQSNYPVSTTGFTNYIAGLSQAVQLGLNDFLSDEALDGILRFNMEHQSTPDFSVQVCIENQVRNHVHRYINKLLSELEALLITHTNIQSLLPIVTDVFEFSKTISIEMKESVKDLITEHALAYNSQTWIDTVYNPIFQNNKKQPILPEIISEIKNQDIFYIHPIYDHSLDNEVKSPTAFTEYWLWYLNLSLGLDVPNHLENLNTLELQERFAKFKMNYQDSLIDLQQKESNPNHIKFHRTVDASLNLMINDLNFVMQTELVRDIRHYENAVHSGFSVFSEYTILLEIYKNEVINIFSRFESKEWSKCVVENMLVNYQNLKNI